MNPSSLEKSQHEGESPAQPAEALPPPAYPMAVPCYDPPVFADKSGAPLVPHPHALPQPPVLLYPSGMPVHAHGTQFAPAQGYFPVPHGSPPQWAGGYQPQYMEIRRETDNAAIASAICGMTGFIPVLSQVAGIILGIVSLRRIATARRAGHDRRGKGWAWTGIVSSTGTLLMWIVVFAGIAVAGRSFGNSGTDLDQLRKVFEGVGR